MPGWKPPSQKKCPLCDKSVYAAEEVKVVVNKEEMSYHKNCFKCIDCGIKLALNTYKVSDFGDPEVFCAKCVPKQAPSQTADTVETRRNQHATALFKDVGIVNEQVRGSEETRGVGMSGAASSEIERAQNASGLARDVRLVNEQLRLEKAGAKGDTLPRSAEAPVKAASSPSFARKAAIVDADAVAESLFKKVRLHKLDIDEIVAKTKKMLAEAALADAE